MKITFKIVTVAIIAMLCAVSCQKETYDSTTGVTCQEVNGRNTPSYSVTSTPTK